MLRVAIVGSGSAGPAAGAFLARQGHEVTLYERAPTKLPVGAGFLLQPTGMEVLDRLGVLEELLKRTARVDKLFCQTVDKRVLLDLHYTQIGPGIYGAGTHRAALLDVLLAAAEEAGVVVKWGREMTRLDRDGSGRVLLDGEGPYDLLLICDGARSVLRAQSGIPARVDRYPWGALWFIGERTEEFDPTELWQGVGTTRELCGFLPTGTDHDLLSQFWSVRVDEIAHWRSQPTQVWRDKVLRLAPQAEAFLSQVEDMSQLQAASYYDVRMKRWHGERVAVLGDAAHALSPQLGQGVNLALLDALALAESVERLPLDEALAAYSKERKKHLAFYQFATRWSTPFFQSDFPALGRLRDVGFPLALRVPWARREMVATMAGVKTGPFSRLAGSTFSKAAFER